MNRKIVHEGWDCFVFHGGESVLLLKLCCYKNVLSISLLETKKYVNCIFILQAFERKKNDAKRDAKVAFLEPFSDMGPPRVDLFCFFVRFGAIPNIHVFLVIRIHAPLEPFWWKR